MTNRVRLLLGSLGATLLLACSGGGGALDDGIVTQDPATHSNEDIRASQESIGESNEGIARTGEPAGTNSVEPSPASGGGFLDCSAKYSCSVTAGGKTKTSTIRFKDGACVDDETAFSPDGTVTAKGVVVGNWHATANGFSVSVSLSTEDGQLSYAFDCTKTAAQEDAQGATTGTK